MKQTPNRLVATLVVLLSLFLASCDKKINLDKWEPDVLAPLLKGTATFKEVTDLRDKNFTQKVPAIDIGYTPFTTVSVPPIKINFVGPYPYTISEYFSFVKVDSALFEIELFNMFPVPISQGTRVVFRSSPDTSTNANIFYSYTLTQDIPAYGAYPKFEDVVTNKTITTDIYLYLENFHSPGGNNVVFDSQPTLVKFKLKFLSVFTVAINAGKEYSIGDTTAMEITDEIGSYDNNTATGMLHFFMNSSMPINFDFQMYFYDETKSIMLDSLYYGRLHTEGNHTTQLGVPLDSVQRKFDIPLTADRIRRLKEAKFMAYRITGSTFGYPPGLVYLGPDCRLRLQLTGDIKLKVSSFLPL